MPRVKCPTCKATMSRERSNDRQTIRCEICGVSFKPKYINSKIRVIGKQASVKHKGV